MAIYFQVFGGVGLQPYTPEREKVRTAQQAADGVGPKGRRKADHGPEQPHHGEADTCIMMSTPIFLRHNPV